MNDLSPLCFAFLAAPGELEGQALLLARSIRSFAGALDDSPVLLLFPDIGEKIAPGMAAEFYDLGVQLLPFEIDPDVLAFPFGPKVFAAAAAEKYADVQADLLVWLDTDAIIIQEPADLIIDRHKAFGYRPVDHRLIASRYADPVDNFWQLIYLHNAVSDDQIFPMITSVDKETIRPYLNAGLLVTRPEKRVLAQWAASFTRHFRSAVFTPFYQQNKLYEIFFHQAVLAGVILATLERDALQELPYRVNYPLHMHTDYPAEQRPSTLNELVTCRYDTAFQKADWRRSIQVNEPLRGWLADQGVS